MLKRLETSLDGAQASVIENLIEGGLDRPEVSREERLRTLLMFLWGSLVDLVPTGVWMVGTLMQERQLMEAVRAESEAGGDELARSIVEETLRLFSRPNMYRQVVEDFELQLSDGRRVGFAAGDWLGLFPRLLHRDPEVFEQPLQFDARRFCSVDGMKPVFTKGGRRLRHPTLSFGLGRGRCPGDVYTISVLVVSLQRWTVALDVGPCEEALPEDVRKTVSSSPGPDRPIYASIVARKADPESA